NVRADEDAQCVQIARDIACIARRIRAGDLDLGLRLVELESGGGAKSVTLLCEREPLVLIAQRRLCELLQREIVRGDKKCLRDFGDQADLEAAPRGFLREEVLERCAVETAQSAEEVELERCADRRAVLLDHAF